MLLRILLLFTLLGTVVTGYTQSDNCSSATTLTVGATCVGTSGTTIGATQTIPGCTGNADDDVWYQFVATSTSHTITVTPSSGMDAVVQLLSGSCSVLQSLSCKDNALTGDAETITYSNFTIGQTYRIRVYDYYTGAGTGTFSICVTGAPSPPANDNCSAATTLTVNASCVTTSGTTVGATPSSFAGCVGDADDDVWYQFVATNPVQTVTVAPSGGMDLIVGVYSGTCSSLISKACIDNTYSGGTESMQLVGLTVGTTYFVRVYDYYTDNRGTFNICVTGSPTPAPTNDDCIDAIQIPTVTSECDYMEFTTVGATADMTDPTPTSCAGAINPPYAGGFSSSSHDVWFAITVPQSGNLTINIKPNMGSGKINDGVMALYSGSCAGLTQIACSENFNYPGAGHDLQPMLNQTGLTPGSTVYLRYWGYGTSQGTFGICVTTNTNDACADALYICDINGYSASTSPAFTPDRPGNMHGNNETAAGVNQPDGTNTEGPFGYYPYPGTVAGPYSSPYLDVNIENNSWIRFTAAATSVTLNVSIADCFVGNYPSGGIQMQIFSANNCANFAPISEFKENSTGFTITANGLTVGNDYLLMVDGYAGDICNYTISANTGVQFPQIPPPAPVCSGTSVTLTAPAGATSYKWLHDGSTSQSVTVTPGSTQTYYCEVTGLCDYKQTLAVNVQVLPSPIIDFNIANNTAICNGTSITINASGANSYSWNTGATTSGITVSPSATTTYTVTGTVSGCTANKNITIVVKPTPAISGTPTTTPADCNGSNGTISGLNVTPVSGSTYQWTNASNVVVGNTLNASGLPVGSYTLTVTNDGCTATYGPVAIANPAAPIVTITPSVASAICSGQSVTLTASGATTYLWNTGATSASIVVSPTSNTSYSVTGTTSGCTGTSNYTVNVKPTPTVTITSNAVGNAICEGQSITLSASGATTYLWNTSATSPSITVSPTSNTTYTVTGTTNGCSDGESISVTVKSNPAISGTPAVTPSNCSANTGAISGLNVSPSAGSSYQWTNASNTLVGSSLNVSNIPAGSYTLTVTNNGCSSTFGPVVVNNPSAPTVSITPSNASAICSGQSVTLTASGATTYLWSNGSTSTSISVSPSSTTNYSVAGTTSGCTANDNYNVVVTPLPTVSVYTDATANTICEGESVTISASGATTYLWNNGSTNSSITVSPISNATYSVTGTTSGCSNSNNISVTVNPLPVISGTAVSLPTDCDANTGSITGLSISPSGAQIEWTDASNNVVGNTATVNNLPVGTYILTVTNNNCSVQYGPVNVSMHVAPSAPTITTNGNQHCLGTTATLSVTPSGGVTYQWSGPNGYTSTNTSISITDLSNTNTGNYCVTATEHGCVSSPSCETIALYPQPTIDIANAASSAVVCENGTASLTATGGVAYSWTGPNAFVGTGANVQIPNFQLINNGYYVVVGTDANGCSDKDSVMVTLIANPTLAVTSDVNTGIYCNHSNAVLSVSGATTYNWSGPNGFQTTGITATVSDLNHNNTGWYFVIGTDNNNCQSIDSIQINISTPQLDLNLSNDGVLCPGESVPFNTDAQNVSYEWTGPQGFITNNQNFVLTNAQPENTGWYYLTITDSNHCMAIDSTYLDIKPNAKCLVIPDLITPDGDNLNDAWHIPGLEAYTNVSVEIYNRWGNLIYKNQPYLNDWKGEVNYGSTIGSSGKVPTGTYFYVLILNDADNTPPFKGYIEVEY
ncbi:MAG: T9SS type B sorting domain-containing protein [Bacteroidia bacterium]|nr:MAG: T9SS type B sorting domain-containing protein [Bacteroidia bacterium]